MNLLSQPSSEETFRFLPPELWEICLGFLLSTDMFPLLTVNKRIYSVALSLLYRHISIGRDPPRSELITQTISSNPQLAGHVRNLSVHWQREDNRPPVSKMLAKHGVELKAFLKCLPHLSALNLNLCIFDGFLELTDDAYPFKLTWFSTSLIWDDALSDFLSSQKDLKILRLESCESSVLPRVDGLALPELEDFYWGPEVAPPLICVVLGHAKKLKKIDGDLTGALDDTDGMLNAVRLFQGHACFTLRLPAFETLFSGETFQFAQLTAKMPELPLEVCYFYQANLTYLLMKSTSYQNLHLGGFPRLSSLNFTGLGSAAFSCSEKGQASDRWFKECLSLRTVAFEESGVVTQFSRTLKRMEVPFLTSLIGPLS